MKQKSYLDEINLGKAKKMGDSFFNIGIAILKTKNKNYTVTKLNGLPASKFMNRRFIY